MSLDQMEKLRQPYEGNKEELPKQEQWKPTSRPERDPVYEYHRVEALKDTPKYKEIVNKFGSNIPENPFLSVLQRLGHDTTINKDVVRKIKLNEIAAHMNGRQECDFSIAGKECHFFPLASDLNYVTNLYSESFDVE
jgi:hypothetical protein